MTDYGGLASARSRRTVLFGRLFAAIVAAIAFASLWLVFHRHLDPLGSSWTGVREGHDDLRTIVAWLDRAVVILCVVLLAARLVRMTGPSEVMRAPRRGAAIAVQSVLLGSFLFALWPPGRDSVADVIYLMALGALAVLLSGIVLALARFRRGYLVESCLALALLLLGVGCLLSLRVFSALLD
jgi:hypothetical protein